MKEDLKDKVILALLEQNLEFELEDYNIQGIVKKGKITKIKIDVKPKSQTEFIEVNFQLKHKSTKKP